jgi:MbtH protein
MSGEEREDSRQYSVVVNDEGQYSIWPVDGPPLRGWRTVGGPKSRAECLSDIETLWTDMRPVSLRKYMDANGAA